MWSHCMTTGSKLASVQLNLNASMIGFCSYLIIPGYEVLGVQSVCPLLVCATLITG